jgi:hypothetical protein
MSTIKADQRKRLTIPCADPGQEFAWRQSEDGTVILSPIRQHRVTNVEPLPKNVLERLYAEREEDMVSIRKLIRAQPKDAK